MKIFTPLTPLVCIAHCVAVHFNGGVSKFHVGMYTGNTSESRHVQRDIYFVMAASPADELKMLAQM